MKKFRIPLYPTEHILTVFIGKDIQKVDKHIQKLLDDVNIAPLRGTEKAFTLTCISNYEKYFIMGLTEKSQDYEIFHEIIHITWYLADECNFDFQADTELQCYLVEYIYKEITRQLKSG